jgi:hypothetical protein
MKNIKSLSISDFELYFGEKLSDYVKNSISTCDFNYELLNDSQYQELLLMILKTLFEGNPVKAGESRIKEWNDGWNENFNLIKKDVIDIDNLTPKYFNKYNVVRLNGTFVQPISSQFEKNTLKVLLDWLYDKYFTTASHIYEFGCGTGHNLLRVRGVNKEATLWGMDWANSSQDIINKIRENKIDSNIFSRNFDYYKPDYSLNIEENSIIYTVASLEQVGNKWVDFVDYLIDQKPVLCVHVEPVEELLANNNVLDYLSIQYFRKRNYLTGFLTGLRNLEKMKKIEILKAERNHIGSLFIEGYSVVVWRPI